MWQRFMQSRLMPLAGVMALTLVGSPKLHAQCTRCCFPNPNITVTPAKAKEGQPVMLTVVVVNCGLAAEVVTAKVNVTPGKACAPFAEAFSTKVFLRARFQARTLTYMLDAPACQGTFKVTESSSNAPGKAIKNLKVE